ncbi:MAG: lysylphosphatidylglycerol synthase transmembrane domain-containing protein [Planctomycetota bacterium]
MRQITLQIAKFVVPAVIILVLLMRMEPSDWESLSERPIHWPFLALALAVAMTAIALSFLRWWVLVRCQEIQLKLLEAFRLSSICFLLSFVSAGSVGGDLFKAIFLARRSPGKRVAAVASVLVDRGAGLYGLLVLVAVGLMLRSSSNTFEFEGMSIDDLKFIVATLVIAGTLVVMILVLGGKFVDSGIKRASKWRLIGGIVDHVGPPLRVFHDHPWAFLASLCMSVGVHGLLVVSMYLIATSMYEQTPTFAEHFIIVPLGMLASALPLTPAGIGVLEFTIDTLYRVVPAVATPAKGLLVALVFEMVKVVLAVIGTIFYWTASSEEAASLEEAEQELSPSEISSDATAVKADVAEPTREQCQSE